MRWLVFWLLGFCSLVFAEQKQVPEQLQEGAPGNRVYSKGSGSKVNNINKTVEVLRDPSAMSGNFRQALRGLQGKSPPVTQGVPTAAGAKKFELPEIEIVGRVYSENKPATVVLKANGKYHHFVEGDQLTRVIDDQLVTFHVQEINEHRVRLLVMPFNKILIFN